MAISFFAEDISFPPIHKRIVTNWIKSVVKDYGKEIGEISYIFCSEENILSINIEYLQHDYYTDIITFDYTEGDTISGDIFISLDTVRSNADTYDTDYKEELHRTIIHGILHLCGIEDKIQREIMEKSENNALSILPESAYKDIK